MKPRILVFGSAALLLAACASAPLSQTTAIVQELTRPLSDAPIALKRDAQSQAAMLAKANALLANELTQEQAVHLALINSPRVQQLLANAWAASNDAAQIGRINNPVFNFERLMGGDERELSRGLGIGLLEILTLPWRQKTAKTRVQAAQLALASQIVSEITLTKQHWVQAIAANQRLDYAKQVMESAEAGAELAKRMEAAGNFNRLMRAREQSFYADAAARVVLATQQALAARELLVRDLGLDGADLKQLKLPSRLPDLPQLSTQREALQQHALDQRLDVQMMALEAKASAAALGYQFVMSLTDIEIERRRESSTDDYRGVNPETTRASGYELDIAIPIFDWGGLKRSAMNARTLAADAALRASLVHGASELRERFGAYRASFDLAKHYRDEIVPLRKTISDENLLRYNGMITGVFELLADARDQVRTVSASIDALEQFWLADAALQASMLGASSPASMLSIANKDGEADAAGH